MAIRTAKAAWNGSLQEGNGTMALGSGAFEGPYSFSSRFEDGKGTNPEELLGAAHAEADRELPAHASDDATARRAKATARTAFVRAFEDEPWHRRIFGSVGRAAVPVVLASVIGIYLMWAVKVANSLFR